MSVWNAVILGLVQGITEFLPVSSSGHLSMINNLFNMSDIQSGHLFFDVLLHLATLISILIVYWKDIVSMTYEALAFVNLGPLAGMPRERYPVARMLFMIVMATLPLFLILPIKDMLETLYYHNIFIGIALVLTGCMLYVSDKMTPGKKTERNMTVLDALIDRPVPVRRGRSRPLPLRNYYHRRYRNGTAARFCREVLFPDEPACRPRRKYPLHR